MASPARDARVSKKQRKNQEPTPSKQVSNTPVGSGRTGSLTSSLVEPAPISPHFQARRLVTTLSGKEPRRQLLAAPSVPGSSVARQQLLAAHQFPEQAEGRGTISVKNLPDKTTSMHDIQVLWENSREKKREGFAWSL